MKLIAPAPSQAAATVTINPRNDVAISIRAAIENAERRSSSARGTEPTLVIANEGASAHSSGRTASVRKAFAISPDDASNARHSTPPSATLNQNTAFLVSSVSCGSCTMAAAVPMSRSSATRLPTTNTIAMSP
jgi:hypothetical protein